MNLNGGQNFVQPSNKGGGIFNQIFGGMLAANQMKTRIELEKHLMDYSSQNRMKEQAFKVASNALGSNLNFAAESHNYGLLHAKASGHKEGTPEYEAAYNKGLQVHRDLASSIGMINGRLAGGQGANVQLEQYARSNPTAEKNETPTSELTEEQKAFKPINKTNLNAAVKANNAFTGRGASRKASARVIAPYGTITNDETGEKTPITDESGRTSGPLFTEDTAEELMSGRNQAFNEDINK
jgi:hypothetical protein